MHQHDCMAGPHTNDAVTSLPMVDVMMPLVLRLANFKSLNVTYSYAANLLCGALISNMDSVFWGFLPTSSCSSSTAFLKQKIANTVKLTIHRTQIKHTVTLSML